MDRLLITLRDAAVNELARQAKGLDGFRPPTDYSAPDSVGYFDGGFRLDPLIIALLRELRKLPESRLVKAIDTALATAPSP